MTVPPRSVPARLAGMMFLHYLVMGAWLVTLTTYLLAPPGVGLGFTPLEVGWIYSTLAIGGFIAPLFVGILADRWFAAERLMSALSLISALLLTAAGIWCERQTVVVADAFTIAGRGEFVDGRSFSEAFAEVIAAEQTAPLAPRTRELREALALPSAQVAANPLVRDAAWSAFEPLFVLMLLYSVCLLLMSTLANVLAMRNLPDPGRSFGGVRLWGTVGWMVAGFAVAPLMVPPSPKPLYLAAAGMVCQAVYARFLPHTPPKGRASPIVEVIGLPALTLFGTFSFSVYAGCLLVVTIMQQFYGVYAPPFLFDRDVRPATIWMTIAQACEVCCLLLIPLLRDRFGLKGLMLLGLGCWVVRNAAFAWGGWYLVVLVGLPLHGASYTFFTIVGSLYIDRLAPTHLRAGAQGLITLVSLGPGMMVGNWLAAKTLEHYRVGLRTDWTGVWLVPLLGCAAAFLIFALLFRAPPASRGLQTH